MYRVFSQRDAAIQQTLPLPSAELTTVYSLPIDLGNSANSQFLAECEVEVDVPAVNETILPDTKTLSYSLVEGDTLDGNGLIENPTVLQPNVIVQTGADGAGADAAKYYTRLKTDVGRYVALKTVSSADTTDASTLSATLDLLF